MTNATDEGMGSELLKKMSRGVEEFLTDLRELRPSGVDAMMLEKRVTELVMQVGLGLMKEVFRRADECAPEVVVKGEHWGNRQVTPGTYTVTFGTFKLDRSGYQQSGRGRVLFPIDERLGIVEGRYSPAMASLMARTIAEMPAERGEQYLKSLGIGCVSVSTLRRIPQDMSAVVERDRVAIEAAVSREWHPPAGTHTIQAAMDGFMVPMDGEHAKPRGRKTKTPKAPRHERHYGVGPAGPAGSDDKHGAAYHEASVATLSFTDREGNHLETIYSARMPEHRKEVLAKELEDALHAALEQCPGAQVALASDGAVTHWEHMDGIQARLPEGTKCRQLLDFCHAAKYLFDAAGVVQEDDGCATALAEGWRSNLRHRKDGPEMVLRALRYQRDGCADKEDKRKLNTIVEFFSEHRSNGRLAYKQAANDAFPIGTGHTEAAAKMMSVRIRRAGARYESHGGQTILTFRAALLSGQFDALMREVVRRYTADVTAA